MVSGMEGYKKGNGVVGKGLRGFRILNGRKEVGCTFNLTSPVYRIRTLPQKQPPSGIFAGAAGGRRRGELVDAECPVGLLDGQSNY